MSAKNVFLIALLALVGVVYYYEYRDSFRNREIKVYVTMRPKIPLRGPLDVEHPPEDMVVFALGTEFKLTGVEVVPVAALQTNKLAPPAWNLVSESNSPPTSTFVYGDRIPGMHPRNKGAVAEPLLPNTDYRITVRAGSLQGHYDFKTRGESAPAE